MLRRTSMALGLLGAILLVVFRRPVSEMDVWQRRSSPLPVAMLALAVWLRSISDGQAALIQGLRRIGDLARISVLSAFLVPRLERRSGLFLFAKTASCRRS